MPQTSTTLDDFGVGVPSQGVKLGMVGVNMGEHRQDLPLELWLLMEDPTSLYNSTTFDNDKHANDSTARLINQIEHIITR